MTPNRTCTRRTPWSARPPGTLSKSSWYRPSRVFFSPPENTLYLPSGSTTAEFVISGQTEWSLVKQLSSPGAGHSPSPGAATAPPSDCANVRRERAHFPSVFLVENRQRTLHSGPFTHDGRRAQAFFRRFVFFGSSID